MGALGWSPTEFWEATPHDLHVAYSGWRKVNGIKEDGPSDMTPAELVAAYEREIYNRA